ncbi:type VII secretion-associated serine protease mycosin [Mycobacterium sp. CVI_P3]|uniref:Type VII secretion-associated serine protease mycosin n=1 Tax=Mycobacterium pinniadriaticum TaxID=2994102 RepID=A0ABT3SHI9_9MYCO|nr:type VII secretion-associated serine protease mycosin [Mycobacterium pinniadriaticum]MCX2932590.1 type VII secretion-associated serine protease mycosin [Mycobacterium pinniadriaticum]MCX2938966.1 type VII secretion-associated serine protease mycosin [Mycobacterium pinniadriaticum]
MIRPAVIAAVVLLVAAPVAGAVNPPVADPATPPPPGTAGPTAGMSQRSECVTTGIRPGSDPGAVNPNQVMLDLAGAGRYSRGEGQTVAVIDTGVRPGPRLPNVVGGGDYLAAGDGLTDCDGHGTLIAGIIGGQPGPDGFSGVAPGARLLSIRQVSPRFSPNAAGKDPASVRAGIEIETLARAVVRAADLGATVINISTAACLAPDRLGDQQTLGAALRYAAIDKDAVIVAAAGDSGGAGAGAVGMQCASNPVGDPAPLGDPRNWAGVTSVSVPSWWQPYVLSVAALTAEGQPTDFTMAGPWVGIAAPGQNIVSVSNDAAGGLANGMPDGRGGMVALDGTSFAAAYVAGAAALVRGRYPGMSADEVVRRLTSTAHNGAQAPSNLVGAGTLDPVGALTWTIDSAGDTAPAPTSRRIAAPVPPPPVDHTPRTVAFIGTAVLAAVVVAAVVTRRRKEERE